MLVFLMCMTGFAGFVDSAAGGGGLISLPAYLFAGLPVHYSTGAKSAAADLALMRRCRAFVLSNSTFSWWGQWLAGVPGRCVIAPDRWYANGKKTALYDHDWTLIPTR